ncbi:hypothetical protein ACFFTN_27585 [Aminobacter aganoensis]|uniref:Uncharacterized protein n=1 Tax=Aminobacter aganoensis TaxID=83264 RepID=A0A7X0KNZ0_9HYPH|nr:hypothetical protein [Aminobacter aganoensis]MBB6357658.1 hypothetical protein [Aminobacter aganoensis]
MATATDRREATAFLDQIDSTPLKGAADAITAPLLALCAGFIPVSDNDTKPQSNIKPMPWPDFYRQLFRTATGALHWAPEVAWNATPTEINEAFAGHIAMLRTIHGSPDDADPKSDDPRQEIAPEKVKAGISKLRGLAKQRAT